MPLKVRRDYNDYDEYNDLDYEDLVIEDYPDSTPGEYYEDSFDQESKAVLNVVQREEPEVDFDKQARDVEKRNWPQILFYPTGEVTPFRLRLIPEEGDDKNNPIMIIATETGRFRLFDSEKDRL